jgi:hypothetical protein
VPVSGPVSAGNGWNGAMPEAPNCRHGLPLSAETGPRRDRAQLSGVDPDRPAWQVTGRWSGTAELSGNRRAPVRSAMFGSVSRCGFDDLLAEHPGTMPRNPATLWKHGSSQPSPRAAIPSAQQLPIDSPNCLRVFSANENGHRGYLMAYSAFGAPPRGYARTRTSGLLRALAPRLDPLRHYIARRAMNFRHLRSIPQRSRSAIPSNMA